MKRSALIPIAVSVAVAVGLQVPQPASAAWTQPGKCRIPATQRSTFEQLDSANNRFSTTEVPCYMAAFAIDGMLRDGRWSSSSFRYTATGARWYLKLSCRGRTARTDAPQPGRVISCRVREGEDGDRERDLAGGSIKWTTKYTG